MGKKSKNPAKVEKKIIKQQKKEDLKKPQTICLNMIVKNEAHIIEELFSSISKYIDYYVISDTGSTDGTQQKIVEYFDKIGIKGEVVQNTWVCPSKEINYFDFGYNRTLALDACRGKSDYIWIIDADDLVIGDFPIKSRRLTADSYTLKYGTGFTYTRHQIFKNDPKFNWHYGGILHEYILSDIKYGSEILDGDYYVDSRRLGSRSKDPLKYLKDAKIFEWMLKRDPNEPRSWFYGAQSYNDSGPEYYEKSIEMYKKRAEMGGFFEEVFYSKLMVGSLMSELDKYSWKESEDVYLDALKFLPIRGTEPIYNIVTHYIALHDYESAYKFAKKVEGLKYPSMCTIFIEKSVYDYRLSYELLTSAYYTGRCEEAVKLCQKFLKKPNGAPDLMIDKVREIMELATKEQGDETNISIPGNNSMNNAMSNTSNNAMNCSISSHIKAVNDLKSKGKYLETYKYCQTILDSELNKTSDREIIEDLRDTTIEHFKDILAIYPASKIAKIQSTVVTTPTSTTLSDGSKNKLIFTITTCKRYDLFEKTINSFINCCNDLHHINHWFCVDDNSSEEDRLKMKEKYPFFEYVFKNEVQKGHCVSMNIIHDKICEGGYEYVLHMEDDWQFVSKYNYIGNALQIFKEDPSYGQVLFNRSYAEVEMYKKRVAGGKALTTAKGLRYILHEYFPQGTWEYTEYVKQLRYPSSTYWPHFSFRPSVVKCSVLKDVGKYYATGHFEMAYANEYVARGYRSTFFDAFTCIHTGKKTWETNKEKSNAYDLNKTDQFVIEAKISYNVISEDDKIDNVQNDNVDDDQDNKDNEDNESNEGVNLPSQVTFNRPKLNRWRKFKNSINDQLPHCTRRVVRNITSLNCLQKQVFVGNEFNYRRSVLNELSTHLDIYEGSNSDYEVVLYDSVTITNGSFSEKIKKIVESMSDYDIVALERFGGNRPKFEITPTKNSYDLIYKGYVISKQGIGKLIENISINHIKTKESLFEGLRVGMVTQGMIRSVQMLLTDTDNTNEPLSNDSDTDSDPDATAISKLMETTEGIEDYVFYSHMDSYGDDIIAVGEQSVENLIAFANSYENCVAFNTLGYLKHGLTDEKEFIFLPFSSKPTHGLFVKKSHLNQQ